jgi:hypothetical protein
MAGPHILPCALAGLLFIAAGGTASAADFGFAVILQVGGGNTWELGIGPRGGAPIATTSLNPFYQEGTPQKIEIGYTQATNTAFLRYYQTSTTYQQATYQPVGGAPLSPGGTWTLPAGSFSVAADSTWFPTSVTVDSLALSAGLSVLQPLSAATLSASQTGIFNGTDFPSASLASPVQFRAQGTGGNWMLSGRISFTGMGGIFGTGIGAPTDNDLRFGFDAGAADVPEPSTAVFMACGLLLIGIHSIRRRRKCPAPSIPPPPTRS